MTSEIKKVNLEDKLSQIGEHWRPKVVGTLNGQEVKLAKFKGEFIWHHHESADELFLCIHGSMYVDFRDRSVELTPGEFLIVPRMVEHRTRSTDETSVLIFEPANTLNTGNISDSTFTAPNGVQL